MKTRFSIIILAMALLVGRAFAAGPEPVTLTAADGVQVFGDWYKADKPKALILLFHQAGSNRGEYATIAPRLVQQGYSAMAIDQRSGGSRFGRSNETVTKLGHSGEYIDAEKDLDAALAWSKNASAGAPVVIWGSSYSSSLVFLVAAKHPDQVAAVLSFSPGEYLGAADTVRSAAAKVTAPVFITSAKDAEEIASAKAILDATASKSKTQFVPTKGGVHGSSTLITDRNAKGAEENWTAVLAFLATLR